jgi:parallel beta-helix repeat protein/predicted outer membrane repeat protein
MIRTFILSAFLFLFFSSFANTTIINIPADYLTIQQGIDASTDGDTVLVQPGTYIENINFNGHNIVLGSLYLTTGDTSYISQTTIDGDSSGTVMTLISGENANAIISGLSIQNGYALNGGGIVCGNGSSPLIENDRITHNYADDNGGGIYCFANSNPHVSGNLIDSNYVASDEISHGGGGIAFFDSSPRIDSNLIQGNSAGSGGGILFLRSSPQILDNFIYENKSHSEFIYRGGGGIFCWSNSEAIISGNEFIGNTAHNTIGRGGAIHIADSPNTIISSNYFENNSADMGGAVACVTGSDVYIEDNLFKNNNAGGGGGTYINSANPVFVQNSFINNIAGDGGAIYGYNSCPTIRYSIFSGNMATRIFGGQGGGIHIYGDWDPLVVFNCVFVNNSSPGPGGAIYSSYYVEAVIRNTIFWGNMPNSLTIYPDSAEPEYCDIQGGLPGVGNIDVDPLFRDTANVDFHLMSTACGDPYNSPCIDAGDPSISDDSLDCMHGLGTAVSDMGAYGGGCYYGTGDVNNSGASNGLDVIYLVSYLKGGAAPPKSCGCLNHGMMYVAADANGSCSVNGLDVTYMVTYFKGGPSLLFCEDCPPGSW